MPCPVDDKKPELMKGHRREMLGKETAEQAGRRKVEQSNLEIKRVMACELLAAGISKETIGRLLNLDLHSDPLKEELKDGR